MFMKVMKDLIEIKDMINKGNILYEKDETILEKIKELDRKIDVIGESLQRESFQKEPININHPESPVKTRRKRGIIKLLESNKKLTSTQLSIITGISRTRCNEYLRELEEEGIAKGTVDDKKKFYRLINSTG